MTEEETARGVIAMSAGNHAQALAYHGRRLNVPTTIVMPRSTPNAKVEQTRVHGAEVLLHGNQFDETRAFTEQLAEERSLTLVHPSTTRASSQARARSASKFWRAFPTSARSSCPPAAAV